MTTTYAPIVPRGNDGERGGWWVGWMPGRQEGVVVVAQLVVLVI